MCGFQWGCWTCQLLNMGVVQCCNLGMFFLLFFFKQYDCCLKRACLPGNYDVYFENVCFAHSPQMCPFPSSSTRMCVWIRHRSPPKNVTACRRDDWTHIQPCKTTQISQTLPTQSQSQTQASFQRNFRNNEVFVVFVVFVVLLTQSRHKLAKHRHKLAKHYPRRVRVRLRHHSRGISETTKFSLCSLFSLCCWHKADTN